MHLGLEEWPKATNWIPICPTLSISPQETSAKTTDHRHWNQSSIVDWPHYRTLGIRLPQHSLPCKWSPQKPLTRLQLVSLYHSYIAMTCISAPNNTTDRFLVSGRLSPLYYADSQQSTAPLCYTHGKAQTIQASQPSMSCPYHPFFDLQTYAPHLISFKWLDMPTQQSSLFLGSTISPALLAQKLGPLVTHYQAGLVASTTAIS